VIIIFRCVCPSGWEGDRCEHDKNECANQNGGCSYGSHILYVEIKIRQKEKKKIMKKKEK